MGSRTRTVRITLASTAALAVLSIAAPSASASFHSIKISEFYGGNAGVTMDDSFIELQMYEAGQNFVNGKAIRFFNANGSGSTDFTLTGNVLNGENQRTIVVGDTLVSGGVDYSADLSGVVLPSGAACYIDPAPLTIFDCVAWGSYTGTTGDPFFIGTPTTVDPFNGTSATRVTTANCPTVLDDADDTSNSAADFVAASPSPRLNTVSPTEVPCPPPPGGGGGGGGASDTTPPDTTITGGPKKKEKKGKATFSFSASEPGSTFECKLDGGAFQGCTTPRDVQVKKGKHTFAVRAIDAAGNVDSSPATQGWAVKKKKKK